MVTKAEKLRKKRGRPIKEGARTETGQLSRAKDAGSPPDETARQARVRIFGISYEDAKTAEASTFVGRLCLLGQEGGGITNDQYQAITKFLVNRDQYRRGIQVPDSLNNATSGAVPIFDEEEAAKRWQKVKERHLGAMSVLVHLQHSLPSEQITMARDAIINDMRAEFLIGAIRLIGNALERYFRG